MAAPPLISSHWFPPDERTTATSINQAANMLGNGLSMLIGPALVNVPSDCTPNNSSCPTKDEIRRDIDDYMYIHAAIAIIIFLLFCVYFPSKPPLPPAQQASRPENVETMMVGEVSVHYISSESVTHGLLNSDYSGDLEPALQDNTDLVPGKYEVRENVILRHPSYFLEVCLIGWLEDLGVLH